MEDEKNVVLPVYVEKFILGNSSQKTVADVKKVRELILRSLLGNTTELLRDSTLLYSSGPSPIIGIQSSGEIIHIKVFSPVVLNKTLKRYPELKAKDNSIDIHNLLKDESGLEEILKFIVKLHPSQLNNKNSNNVNMKSSRSTGANQQGGKQFKLPRKSASGS